MKTPREIGEAYWRAEAARDVDAIMKFYASDAVFQLPTETLRGHDEIRPFYEESGKTFPGLVIDVVDDITNGNRAALEWDAVLTDEEGESLSLRGVNLVEIEDDRFVNVKVYFDPSEFNRRIEG